MGRRKRPGEGQKPKPFALDKIKCRVVRGPHRDASNCWYWQAVVYEDRKQLTVWRGWGTADEAKAALAPLLMGMQAQPSRREDRVSTVKDLLEVWLASQEQRTDIGDARKLNSLKEAEHLAVEIGTVVIVRLDTSVLAEYQRVRHRQNASTGVINNEISTMVQAWRWGGQNGVAPNHQLRRPKRLTHVPRYNNYVPDLVEFWKAVDAVPDARAWARTMLLLMGGTGARPGEIAALRWEDFHWRRRTVRLNGKTGERLALVRQDLLDELEPLRPEPPTGRVLPVSVRTARIDIRKILRAACETAQVPHFLPKSIRAMVENAMFDAGADPGVVSRQLGHTPEVSLKHYRRAKAGRVEDILSQAGIGSRPDGNVVSLAEHRRAKDT